MQARTTLCVAALAGFTGVALGAFGAHALKALLTTQQLGWWNTAVLYHLVHAAVLLGLSAWLFIQPQRALKISAVCMLVGLILFSGSLYTMALTDIRALGMVTPLGGLSWLAGWAALVIAAFKLQTQEQV